MQATEQEKSTKQRSTDSELDDKYLYGTFLGSLKDKQNLQNKAIETLGSREDAFDTNYRKSRNLPVKDDMQIDASRRTVINHNGMSLLKSAAIAALVGSAGVGGWLASRLTSTPDRPAETITRPHSDADTHFRLRIKDPD